MRKTQILFFLKQLNIFLPINIQLIVPKQIKIQIVKHKLSNLILKLSMEQIAGSTTANTGFSSCTFSPGNLQLIGYLDYILDMPNSCHSANVPAQHTYTLKN